MNTGRGFQGGRDIAGGYLKKETRQKGHEISLAGKTKEKSGHFERLIKARGFTRIMPIRDQCIKPEDMGDVLNKFFSPVFTKRKYFKSSRFSWSSEILDTH